MKKCILSLLSATFVCTAFAANCVSVKQISTDYANHKITIAITRTGCTGDATNHRNTAWVFVDYRTVTGATKGAWTRATISATSAGTVVNSSSSKGAWINGANGTQTETLTLSGMPAKYDWCAFATDYPPNSAAYSGGVHTLKGSTPFIINGSTTVTNTAYTGTINTITDATGCPGWIERDVPTASGTCRTGLTPVGGYCRDLAADGAAKFTGCGYELEVKLGISTPPATWNISVGCPGGWVPATRNQIKCFYENARVATNTLPNTVYQTAEYYGTHGLLASSQGCNQCTGGSYWSISYGNGQMSYTLECSGYAPCLLCAAYNGGYEHWARCANTVYKKGAKCVR